MRYFPKKQFNGDPGDTILFSSYGEAKPHLWVVVTAPDGNPPEVVAVNLTSKRRNSDTTVVLRRIHHPFIDHETVVDFSKARVFRLEDLIQRIEDGIGEADDRFSDADLKTIQQGILQSKRTPRYIQDCYRKMLGQQS